MKYTLKTAKLAVLMAFSAFLTTQAWGAQIAEPRKKIILWDLGYVLVKPNQGKMSKFILPQTCGWNPLNYGRLGMLWAYGHLNSRSIQTTMDNVLHHARPNEPRQEMIVNQHGEPHANIDCDQQVAAKLDKELFAEVQESICKLAASDTNKPYAERFFKNVAHKYLVEKTFQLRFAEPKLFGESFTPIKPGVELLEKCVKAGHEMAVLSNWGAESFPYMKFYDGNDVIFKHIRPEHIFVSGNIKVAKPYPQAYEHVIEKMQAQPDDFIFIDDQIKNVEAARAVGMHAIHVTDYKKPGTYQAVEAELKRLGAL